MTMTYISFGLIAFALINREPVFILVQRAESIPYILFATNTLHKVDTSIANLEDLLLTMTNTEKENILKSTEPGLQKNKEKYKHILEKKTDNVLEWSFPKGRKGKKENIMNGVQIAVREFEEETIFKKKQIEYIFRNDVYSYTKIGSDNKNYKYILYPAIINVQSLLKLCDRNSDETTEKYKYPKDLCIIFPNKTNETSNVSLMGINALQNQVGVTSDIKSFLISIYDHICSLSRLVAH
jgi:hypothetical protein